MRFIAKLIFIFTMGYNLSAQTDSANLVKYTNDFKFEEGIYLNFEQLKSNNPVPKSRIISELDYTDIDFFDKILSKPLIYFYDNMGIRKELSSKNIWGYSRNGFIYIGIDGNYFRITMIGAICHFVATQTYYSSFNHGYYGNSYYDPYQTHSPTTEMRQYLFDFFQGRVLDYDVASLQVLLMADPELHDDYEALSKKNKQKQKFLYIRKFNERHPIYFPGK